MIVTLSYPEHALSSPKTISIPSFLNYIICSTCSKFSFFFLFKYCFFFLCFYIYQYYNVTYCKYISHQFLPNNYSNTFALLFFCFSYYFLYLYGIIYSHSFPFFFLHFYFSRLIIKHIISKFSIQLQKYCSLFHIAATFRASIFQFCIQFCLYIPIRSPRKGSPLRNVSFRSFSMKSFSSSLDNHALPSIVIILYPTFTIFVLQLIQSYKIYLHCFIFFQLLTRAIMSFLFPLTIFACFNCKRQQS